MVALIYGYKPNYIDDNFMRYPVPFSKANTISFTNIAYESLSPSPDILFRFVRQKWILSCGDSLKSNQSTFTIYYSYLLALHQWALPVWPVSPVAHWIHS